MVQNILSKKVKLARKLVLAVTEFIYFEPRV